MSKRERVNSIRIIAGQWRGRRVPVLNSQGLRPTADRVRETLFNWLMHDIAGARCIDLFAGTGVLGLECLSRGAEYVCFIESDHKVAAALANNLEHLQLEQVVGQVDIADEDAITYLSKTPPLPYDVVFLDPPFRTELLAAAIELLDQRDWLAAQAAVYVEQPSHQPSLSVPDTWQLSRQGKAGESRYLLYRLC